MLCSACCAESEVPHRWGLSSHACYAQQAPRPALARPVAAAVDTSKLGRPEQYLQPTGFVAGGGGGPATAAGGAAAASAAHQAAAGVPAASAAPASYAAAASAPQSAYGMPAIAPAQRPQYVLPPQLQPQQQQHIAMLQRPQLQQPVQQPVQSAYQQPFSQPAQQYAPAMRPAMQYQQPQQQLPPVQYQQAAPHQLPAHQLKQQEQAVQPQQVQQQQQQVQQQSAAQQPAAAADSRKRPFEGEQQVSSASACIYLRDTDVLLFCISSTHGVARITDVLCTTCCRVVRRSSHTSRQTAPPLPWPPPSPAALPRPSRSGCADIPGCMYSHSVTDFMHDHACLQEEVCTLTIQAVRSSRAFVSTAPCCIRLQDGNDDDEAGPSGTGGGGDDAFAGSDEGEDPLAGLSSDDEADDSNLPNAVLAQFEKVNMVNHGMLHTRHCAGLRCNPCKAQFTCTCTILCHQCHLMIVVADTVGVSTWIRWAAQRRERARSGSVS